LITLPQLARWRIAALACTVLVFVVCRLPAGGANDAIHIWVIGSPYEDSLPAVPSAVRLREEVIEKRRGAGAAVAVGADQEPRVVWCPG